MPIVSLIAAQMKEQGKCREHSYFQQNTRHTAKRRWVHRSNPGHFTPRNGVELAMLLPLPWVENCNCTEGGWQRYRFVNLYYSLLRQLFFTCDIWKPSNAHLKSSTALVFAYKAIIFCIISKLRGCYLSWDWLHEQMQRAFAKLFQWHFVPNYSKSQLTPVIHLPTPGFSWSLSTDLWGRQNYFSIIFPPMPPLFTLLVLTVLMLTYMLFLLQQFLVHTLLMQKRDILHLCYYSKYLPLLQKTHTRPLLTKFVRSTPEPTTSGKSPGQQFLSSFIFCTA